MSSLREDLVFDKCVYPSLYHWTSLLMMTNTLKYAQYSPNYILNVHSDNDDC